MSLVLGDKTFSMLSRIVEKSLCFGDICGNFNEDLTGDVNSGKSETFWLCSYENLLMPKGDCR